MRHVAFALALLTLPILGFGAAFHPSVRRFSFLSRASAALAMGVVSLTMTAILLSTLDLRWSIPALALPPLALSFLLWRRWGPLSAEPRARLRPSRAVALTAVGASGLAVLDLGWSLLTAGATSPDFVIFWGVKAVRFAEARGIDAVLLRWPFFAHAVPDYPPLVPILQAWTVLVTGDFSWRLIPMTSMLWVLAVAPLLLESLLEKLPDDTATAVTTFWLSAISISLAHSFSGGIAEAPLVFFETLAVATLLTEEPGRPSSRFLPALMLAGAALTKVEGSVAAILIVGGTFVRDLAASRSRRSIFTSTAALLLGPAIAISSWFLFQSTHGLAIGYAGHGSLLDLNAGFLPTIFRQCLRQLHAGTFGLSWAIPALVLLALRPRPLRLAPALALTGGLLVFLVTDYMHDRRDPTERIRWTFPRVSQSALSAWILAAGIVSSARPTRDDRS